MWRIGLFVLFLSLIFSLSIADAEFDSGNTSDLLSHYLQGGVYERLGQLNKAIDHYNAALDFDSESPQIHLRLAVVLLKQNNFDQATQELKLVIKCYENSPGESAPETYLVEAHTLLALVYSLQGKEKEATVEYEIALRGALDIDPRNIRIHKSLTQIYFQEGKLSEAKKTCRVILELAPDDSEAYFFLGSIYEKQGKRKRAIGQFKKALKFDSEYHEALNSLGYVYAEESINLKLAEEMIKRALVYQPTNGAYVDSLGWVYFKQGKYEEAINQLEQAVRFLRDPVIYEHLGDAYLKQNEIVKAIENWHKSLDLNSEDSIRIKAKIERYEARGNKDVLATDESVALNATDAVNN